MKKILMSLFALGLLLLSGTYFVGAMVEKQSHKLFAKKQPTGVSTKLISYDNQFFKATAVSEIQLTVEGEKTLIIEISSAITHYPYKAVINNKVRLLNPQFSQKVNDYFNSSDWISAQEEVNLFGQLSGRLTLLAGSFDNGVELFSTQPLALDYQVNLHDYSGSLHLATQALHAQTKQGALTLTSIQVTAHFSAVATRSVYDYLADIATIDVRQASGQLHLQGVELQGESRSDEQAQRIDTDNEWKVALYQMGSDRQKKFTNNQIKFAVKGLSAPALNHLNSGAGNSSDIAQALSELFTHGARLTLTELSSQTPWGTVDGALDVTLQEGAVLADITHNPFMLLDYISGSANLQIPEALLELPSLSNTLQRGLQSGFLQKQGQVLSLETQFEQGELTVNGRVIPL